MDVCSSLQAESDLIGEFVAVGEEVPPEVGRTRGYPTLGYIVLMLDRRLDGIAYRRGIGTLDKDKWNAQWFVAEDIVLE